MASKRRRFAANAFLQLGHWESVGIGGASRAPAELASSFESVGRQFRLYLLRRYLQGKMTGQDITTIAYYHTKSGGCGLEDLSLGLARKTGHAEHVDFIIEKEFPLPDLFEVPTPVYSKHSCRRICENVLVNLPTRIIGLSAEATDFTDRHFKLLGSVCETHPVVGRARGRGTSEEHIRPVALYWDGVLYNKRHTFVGMCTHDIRRDARHVLWLVRKHEVCRCGCKGWCTFWPLLDVLRWDLNVGATGLHALVPQVSTTIIVGVTPLGFFIAVVGFRGDWPAVAEFLACRTWAHLNHPCLICKICKRDVILFCTFCDATLNPTCDWTAADHVAEVARCARRVVISSTEMRDTVGKLLRYVKNGRGRCLSDNFVTLGLQTLDRLEPAGSLFDVDQFEAQTCPFEAVFWRGRDEDRLLHDSPLLHIEGASIRLCGVDLLHGWDLGPLQVYTASVIWHFLRCNVFHSPLPWLPQTENNKLALLRIKSLMFSFYARRRRSDLRWHKKGSEVWDLSLPMIGPAHAPLLAAKAKETEGLVPFCVELLRTYRHLFVGLELLRTDTWIEAGLAAMSFKSLLDIIDGVPTISESQRLLDYVVRHVKMYSDAGGRVLPKHHAMIHMVQQIQYLGHPRGFTCFIDETLNGIVARIARSVHSTVFSRSVHRKHAALQILDVLLTTLLA